MRSKARTTDMSMINAAKLAALCEPSDPHAYNLAMAHMRQGLDTPTEVREASCKRLGIANDPVAIKQRLARG